MFTGIITDIGRIRSVRERGDRRVEIKTAYDPASIDIGASIACSGVCLTVVARGGDSFSVDVSAETVARTAPGLWSEGRRLNLERALRVGDELGGHIVTGHVDAVGEIVAVQREGDSHRVRFRAPPSLAPYIAAKGSITLDGVSLTVNDVTDDEAGTSFGINIIPHTARCTTFDAIETGRAVHIEIDIMARYMKRMQDYERVWK